MSRLTLLVAALAAALALPASSALADTPVIADPAAEAVTTLDGTVVWVSGAFGAQRLMQHDATGDRPVQGARTAKAYRTVDLGRDARNRLVLTYRRCSSLSRCTAFRDDLRGRRSRVRGLALPRCALTTAPALWRSRTAYGLVCHRPGSRTIDSARSGLYVKTGSAAPRRLRLPRRARQAGIATVDAVDVRGTRVAALSSDIFSFVFSQSADGTGLHAFLAGASEGESDEHVVGLALGTQATLWALTDATHTGDPNVATIFRQRGGCLRFESLENASEADEGFRATGLAADGAQLLLVAPGTGIVGHAFAPEHGCG